MRHFFYSNFNFFKKKNYEVFIIILDNRVKYFQMGVIGC